ncbi:protein adenylyltransferase SelO, mitochondrial-like [Mya arenaria]|uniref:protein adenylyltransferase SelO, mitochondrial-like n=1 Tax=Mya arenaria TaxID=6604 RepID=UPI0022DED34A|nr:protein adenylyltransferase SelO, mitochondrial-like [Mya arenaria]
MFFLRKFYTTLIRSSSKMASLESLNFDNLALKSLPLDPEKDNSIRQVSGACFSLVKPAPVENPKMVVYSMSALKLLDIEEEDMKKPESAEFFGGNRLLPGSQTAAHCYCGHQFGYFSGQLGDGAAMYLGEVVNTAGERWEIQLKGAGPTPYSRHSDGRKVLRSTIREFLCSEAMHHLGIGTTRAGTCVTSDTTVVRDIFYDGNPIKERCTLVLRIAPTFFRFGSFEVVRGLSADTGRKGPSEGNMELLKTMLDYCIQTFYPEIWSAHSSNKEDMYFEFWCEVVRRTARLVADWQCVGWCHGVLNTDNMSIMGITIDYGPFGFLDRYQADFICNGSDDGGRYTYQKQPEMCKWNCKKLADTIKLVLPPARTEPILHTVFDDAFKERYMATMRKKFGLKKEEPGDKDLVDSFLEAMENSGADFTNSFRCLSRLPLPNSSDFEERLAQLKDHLLSQCCTAEELKTQYRPRMDPRQLQMFIQLMQTNPGVLSALGPRFATIAQEIERLEKLQEMESVTDESKRGEDSATWTDWLSKYTDRLRQEEEGLTDFDLANSDRVKVMNATNPRFILRNYIAENAIKAAEKGDYSEVRRVLKILENPYSETADLGDLGLNDLDLSQQQADDSQQETKPGGPGASSSESSVLPQSAGAGRCSYDSRPPEWASTLRVT